MSEPIADPAYWKLRLESSRNGSLHHSVFRCPADRWERIEQKHRMILSEIVGRTDSIFDAGCGYGRLLGLMPHNWTGMYLGLDLCPEFVELARQHYPSHPFITGSLASLPTSLQARQYDWAVLISMRPMIKRNLGDDAWAQMERELRRVARKLLYLEYDENDNGSIE